MEPQVVDKTSYCFHCNRTIEYINNTSIDEETFEGQIEEQKKKQTIGNENKEILLLSQKNQQEKFQDNYINDLDTGNEKYSTKTVIKLLDMVSSILNIKTPLCENCFCSLLACVERARIDAGNTIMDGDIVKREEYGMGPQGGGTVTTATNSAIDTNTITNNSAVDTNNAAANSAVDANNAAANSAVDTNNAAANSAVDTNNAAANSAVDANNAAANSAVDANNAAANSAIDTNTTANNDRDTDTNSTNKILKDHEEALREERMLLHEIQQLNILEQSISKNEELFQNRMQDQQSLQTQLYDTQYTMKVEQMNVQNMIQYLKQCNPILDLFPISYSGHIGTINNFRLGRTPTQQVDWEEINIALGQVTLLLDMIQKRFHISTNIHIISRGALSEIQKQCNNNSQTSILYPLYRIDIPTKIRRTLSYTGLLNYNSNETYTMIIDEFDYAIILLATFIETLGIKLQHINSSSWIHLNHQYLGEYPLIYNPNKEVDWTFSMANLLTNCQLLMLSLI